MHTSHTRSSRSGRGTRHGGQSRGRSSGGFRNKRGGSSFRNRAQRGGTKRRAKQGTYIDPERFVNRVANAPTEEVFTPKHTFADFPVDPRITAQLIERNYTPTPIQDQSIPRIIEGSDVVGVANTGTGKTVAFLVPLVHKIVQERHGQVLIIVPTRELATQIEMELSLLAPARVVRPVTCVGGMSIGRQISQLRRGARFIIGTPGRLKDLVNRGDLDLSFVHSLVLDEADRMLDMGFINDIRFLLSHVPSERQTLLFSATMPPEARALVSDFMREPVTISVQTRDTSKDVDQDVVKIPAGASKLEMLSEMLGRDEFEKVLVFGRTKHGVEKLSKVLAKNGIKADSIHGNKTQPKRDRVLADFKKDKLQVLVATDVAARGIDVPNVSHVINYDVPGTYEDYIHRIGRTGRGGKKGIALTFVD